MDGVIKKTIKNNFLMLSYIHKFCPGHIALILFYSVFASLVPVINLYITRYIINELQLGNNNYLFQCVLAAILISFVIDSIYSAISIYMQNIIIPRNAQAISCKMQSKLFYKSSIIEMKYYDNPEFYDVFSIALQQSDSRAQEVLNTLNMFISSLFSIGALITLIAALEPLLLFLVIINVVLSFGLNIVITKLQHSLVQESVHMQREMEYSKYVFYRAENAKELRMNGSLKDMIKSKFMNASNKMIDLLNKYGKQQFCYAFIQDTVNNTFTASIFIYLTYKALHRLMPIGDFVTLSSSTRQLAAQILGFIGCFSQMYKHSLFIENFKEFIEYQPPVNHCNGIELDNINSIEFKNVSFQYPLSNIEVLKKISFKIETGEKIAIVGENGAGKSTLIKLLTGLYDVGKGEIIVNGKDIKMYELNSFRKSISVAFQDYKTFALSIAENILMHSVDISKKEDELVLEALEFVGLLDKVMKLPEGIYTKLTKEFDTEGTVFSGGEIQKIVLARAYASKSSLLILDEPSSSLDPIAEYDMFHKMMELSKNKCTIIISHRLKNIVNVDRIYVMEDGKIIERGTHEALMKEKGTYFNMYNKQNYEIGSAAEK